MATAQNKKKDKIEFFKFDKVGDSITGKVTGFIKTGFGINLVFDGKTAVGLNKVQLSRLVVLHADAIMQADKVVIEFKKESKGKSGFKTKVFAVYVDGEELLNEPKAVDAADALKELQDSISKK